MTSAAFVAIAVVLFLVDGAAWAPVVALVGVVNAAVVRRRLNDPKRLA